MAGEIINSQIEMLGRETRRYSRGLMLLERDPKEAKRGITIDLTSSGESELKPVVEGLLARVSEEQLAEQRQKEQNPNFVPRNPLAILTAIMAGEVHKDTDRKSEDRSKLYETATKSRFFKPAQAIVPLNAFTKADCLGVEETAVLTALVAGYLPDVKETRFEFGKLGSQSTAWVSVQRNDGNWYILDPSAGSRGNCQSLAETTSKRDGYVSDGTYIQVVTNVSL